MASGRAKTIDDYIRAAPGEGRGHLRRIDAILRSVAPKATRTIKWGMPFFVEPRFLFAFAAHKKHLSFVPMAAGLKPFKKDLKKYETMRGGFRVYYDQPLPEGLIRRIAQARVRAVRERRGGGFW